MATDYVHQPIEILELQITTSTLQNEVLMRYVSNPTNLGKIREILTQVFHDLGALTVDESMLRCPDGWTHVACRCVTPPMVGQCYVPGEVHNP